MYIPDWSMVKRLKDYDSKLDVKWHPQKERWAIVRRVPDKHNLYDKEILITHVTNPDGSYRPLDERVLTLLKQSDHYQRGSRAVIEEMIDNQKKQELSHQRDTRNTMESIAAETTPMGGYDDPLMGSRNVPKEDVPSVEQFIEERERLNETLVEEEMAV